MSTTDPFKTLLAEARTYYQSIGNIHSPALAANVHFNSNGFHHLRYNNSRAERSKPEQRNKLTYLKQAVHILKIATIYQEYREIMAAVGTPNAQGFRTMTKVGFYAFWAVLEQGQSKIRIKVIVRKVLNSNHYIFWSIMPYWTEKIVNGQTVRYFASPNIAEE